MDDSLNAPWTSLYMDDCYAKLSSEQRSILKAVRANRLDVLEKYKNRGVKFDFNNNNPLREAVFSNRIKILRFLWEDCKIDLNAESGFAIRWAARRDYVDMVR